MTDLEKSIEEFKRRTNRPYANPHYIVKLLDACGGDLDKAVNLILTKDLYKKSLRMKK